ncbi:non-homologous end-joining DNA ligase [Chitinophaga horti]|uniref:Non-homologous end-joining DNA ligase n=1 Tax=Chitinophaga horti TaxID=2920382 RepID=A0ABY6J231_9BACT|nr:non-homologous end-joining DNA ligase [Chitinophaga horti]UYQ92692.1 non-homologous end-joining DNA ligase [Chitinophaga horti]
MQQETQTRNGAVKLNGHQVQLTNQSKIYWPEEKITKGELVDYYLSVADIMLPHLKNRPMSLHRFPNGIKGVSFYQKDLDVKNIPDWLKTVAIHASSTGKDVDYLLCNNEATLAYMANLGCIEVNPWLSRTTNLDNPDYIVLDLDPEDISFKHVIDTALCIRDILEEMDIGSYVKTSGSTGLHIYIPVACKYEYEVCRFFAQHVATEAHERMPDVTSITRAKAQRKHKVYIDYLQNSFGQTVAAPYSARPKPGATVSAPLLWKEVTGKLKISDYHIGNMHKRLDKVGDLWKEIHKQRNDLKAIIKNMDQN